MPSQKKKNLVWQFFHSFFNRTQAVASQTVLFEFVLLNFGDDTVPRGAASSRKREEETKKHAFGPRFIFFLVILSFS